MSGEERTARLIEARRLSAAHKRRNALRTIDVVRRCGDRITFAGIAREAGVSGWFVRNQPDVRAAIEHAIHQQDSTPTPDKRTRRCDESTAGLRAELLLAREEIRDLRRERQRRRLQLRTDLGIELDQASRAELAQRVVNLEHHNRELVAERDSSTAHVARLTHDLSTLADELAAARTANRRLMRGGNQPATVGRATSDTI